MVAPRTVIALLALLLTATHCVDIDDRDLEVTDGNNGTGGGNSCGPEADDTDCTLCTKDNCCSEIETCNYNVDCVDFADCWFGCLDDICEADCAQQYPDGIDDFADFIDCTYQECLDECS